MADTPVELAWELFHCWEGDQYQIFSEWGVGLAEEAEMRVEIEEMRQRVEAAFGPEPD